MRRWAQDIESLEEKGGHQQDFHLIMEKRTRKAPEVSKERIIQKSRQFLEDFVHGIPFFKNLSACFLALKKSSGQSTSIQ